MLDPLPPLETLANATSSPVSDVPRPTTASFGALSAALCCRYGDAEQEARRRAELRAVLRAARDLATALTRLADEAAPHLRGEHATADVERLVAAVECRLGDLAYATDAVAETHTVGADSSDRGSIVLLSALAASLPATALPI